MKPKVSIVIPTFNHLSDALRPCLESIRRLTDLSQVEVIVVSNGSTDGTQEYVNSLGQPFKLLDYPEPLGYSKAVNAGIRESAGEYVVLLNNDTVILEQDVNTWIDQMLKPFGDDPKMGITGPMMSFCPYSQEFFLIFFCVMIKSSLFDELGLLDESFGLGFGEDVDFCIRAKRAGYNIVQVPNSDLRYDDESKKRMIGSMPIFHEGEATLSELDEKPINGKTGTQLLRDNRLKLLHMYGVGKTKLNLGSSDKFLDGYINVDLFYEQADLKMDCRKLDFPDNSIAEIISIHLIEHISPYDVKDMLAEWFRVLKPGGKIIIETPDMLETCKRFAEADKDERYRLLNCIHGVGTVNNPHLFCWYDEILIDHLQGVGFTDCRRLDASVYHWGHNMRIECWKPDNLPDGYFSRDDIDYYRGLANHVPVGGKMVEVGTWRGRSICSIADIINERQINVSVVDTFMGTKGEDTGDIPLEVQAKHEDIEKVFRDNAERFGLSVGVVKHDSIKASEEFADDSLDLVFIDADHSYEAVRADIEAWYPKVKPGGILSGHDIMWDTVEKAVAENFERFEWGRNTWHIVKPYTHSRRVVDLTMFGYELDVLEVRLNELDSVVDDFVIIESTLTHSGISKPLVFQENRQRFDKFLHKIHHRVIDGEMPKGNSPQDHWAREQFQRDKLKDVALSLGLKNDDVIIVSDVDEIPKASVIKNYNVNQGIVSLEQQLFYYDLNCRSKEKWTWGKILPWSIARNMTPCAIRYAQDCPVIPNAGWHFSYMGTSENVSRKISATPHQEYNTSENNNIKHIDRVIDRGRDPYGRPIDFDIVEIDDSYPKYILDNLNYFRNISWIRKRDGLIPPITAYISTKDRYHSTLPLTVQSIANQTLSPSKIIIFDDGEQRDLRHDPLYHNLFMMLNRKNIELNVIFGDRVGQVANHQKALDVIDTEYIWRVDDDEVPEPDCLDILYGFLANHPSAGAVAGLVIDPSNMITDQCSVSNKIENIDTEPNIQWFSRDSFTNPHTAIEVDHLYSSFLFRKSASIHGYNKNLSAVGHREETMFTHSMKDNWSLYVIPSAVTWHYRFPSGGIRSYSEASMWESDEKIFRDYLKNKGIDTNHNKEFFVLDSGLGDHIVFKMVLPEIREKFKDSKIAIAACYPSIFYDEEDVEITSIAAAKNILGDIDRFNIYKFMVDKKWSGKMIDAYREMYLQ